MIRTTAIRFWMKEREIKTQEELAQRVDIPRPRLSQIMRNKGSTITLDTLDKLCSGLNVPPQDLIEWHPNGIPAAAE